LTEYALDLPTRRKTTRLAGRLSPLVRPGDLYVLSGPLGAGKTFFVRAVCRALGLDESFRVTSPTFTLVHEYPTVPPVLHVDLYRLGSMDEVRDLGLVERRSGGSALFVEWGEKAIDALGGDATVIELFVSPRRARVHSTGAVSAARVEAMLELAK
jgi:tRNA threonylcarbamoyladenosine biosynthesis protein TsaE